VSVNWSVIVLTTVTSSFIMVSVVIFHVIVISFVILE
jgi:hypothetical protein